MSVLGTPLTGMPGTRLTAIPGVELNHVPGTALGGPPGVLLSDAPPSDGTTEAAAPPPALPNEPTPIPEPVRKTRFEPIPIDEPVTATVRRPVPFEEAVVTATHAPKPFRDPPARVVVPSPEVARRLGPVVAAVLDGAPRPEEPVSPSSLSPNWLEEAISPADGKWYP